MAKEAYYFSHDSNARHDPKCSALINDFGAEGYGIFWMVIEILSEQENYKLRKFAKLYEGLSRQLWVETPKFRSIVEAMLNEYELLVEDGEFIWSESLLRRMELKEEKRQRRVEAGRKGGIKSGSSRSTKTENEAMLEQSTSLVEANEPKESKRKESKRKESKGKETKTEYAEFVSMTEEEYAKLVTKYGETFTKTCIEALDNYKGASRKKYASDYRAMLTWVVDKVTEKQGKGFRSSHKNLIPLPTVSTSKEEEDHLETIRRKQRERNVPTAHSE